MKAARFGYERASSLQNAVALLGGGGGFVKLLAGGQTLGPMLNLRLVQPDLLVDVTKLSETTGWSEEPGAVLIGACITHAAIEDGKVPDPTGGILPRVASRIAYRAVRNRGTIGGSLAHADPAADWLSALAALGAEIVLVGPRGERRVAVAVLSTGVFSTTIAEDEVMRAVRIPRLTRHARWGYYKFCRKTGDFAEAIGAVLHDPEREHFRLVMGATNGPPIVLDGAALGVAKNRLPDRIDPAILERALEAHGFAGDDYGNQVHLVAASRAYQEALRA
ncbi:MAG: FAD binding domain-containing protein [Alphaproteobacteria bacterium]|nr:FAD binding domain-containing protein [Alphaproteobacteria bacterium]